MTTEVHATAIVDPHAELGANVIVGPYCVIDGRVKVGDGCVIGPFCRLTGDTVIGAGNRFESHVSVGTGPQDLSYAGEPTRVEIGNGNVFREFISIHRGTPGGGGLTSVGNDGFFMAYAHIAHDCHVGSKVIFANGATLAGHVEVGDFATVGAFTPVHQFCRVGMYAFIGGSSAISKDCLPYMKTVGSRPAKCFGPNSIGLARVGFSEERRKALKDLWRCLRSAKLTTSQAVEKANAELAGQEDVDLVLEFIAQSQRGVTLANG